MVKLICVVFRPRFFRHSFFLAAAAATQFARLVRGSLNCISSECNSSPGSRISPRYARSVSLSARPIPIGKLVCRA